MPRRVNSSDKKGMVRIIEHSRFCLPGNVGLIEDTDGACFEARFQIATMGPHKQYGAFREDFDGSDTHRFFHHRATIEPKDPTWNS